MCSFKPAHEKIPEVFAESGTADRAVDLEVLGNVSGVIWLSRQIRGKERKRKRERRNGQREGWKSDGVCFDAKGGFLYNSSLTVINTHCSGICRSIIIQGLNPRV